VAGVAFSEALVARVAKARRGLAAQLNGTQGVILEDKTLALTVHYRKARWPDEIRARAVVHQFVDQFDGALKCVEGDCALEILPREIPNKGDVVRKIWRSRAPQALPVFAGNDATDEPAFVALASGITIRTGAARHTRAQYWVRDAGEVGWFLGRLEEELRKRRHPVSNS